MLSVSFEQMTNKMDITEHNFQKKEEKTIDAKKKGIEALKVNLEYLEVQHLGSKLKVKV